MAIGTLRINSYQYDNDNIFTAGALAKVLSCNPIIPKHKHVQCRLFK